MVEQTDRIKEMSLEDVMGERFGRYSKYIIQERALPDIRDGLKPVQRRILYAMYIDGNTYDKPFRKSAKSVGNVMGNFHPHGDSSIYEAMVRLSQDWKVREPLIQMHGNNGSLDGDPPAAMRYTEARVSKISNLLLSDIDKETVEMVLNFDDTENEPVVLPAHFPNLLVNGATGISAGYATEIPPHNLSEVIDATVYLLEHPGATLDDLMQYVKGPDFPTGAIIQGEKGIRDAYETGRGKIVVRSKTSIVELRGHREQIVVTEIPYEVNKALLVKKIDEIRALKKIDGISEVRDESDRNGLSIVIELKKGADASSILNYLFKNTDLQISYNFNMVAINHMTPEQVGLKTILSAYLEHKKDVVLKRTAFDLNKAQKRQHIVEGLIKALSILDEVIRTIRASSDKKNAKDNLVTAYDFTEAQAEAIVSLQLYRLTNTDVNALRAEHKELADKILGLQQIINDQATLNRVITDELVAVKKEYGNPRRSAIQREVSQIEIDTSALIAKEDVRVLVSANGYLKRSSLRSYNSTDAADNGLRDDDQIVFDDTVSTLASLYIFTNKGNLIYRPVHELLDVKWKDTGSHLSQEVGLLLDEQIIQVFVILDLAAKKNFLLATDDGYIKQVSLADLQPSRTYRSKAAVAMKLKGEGNKLVHVSEVEESAASELVLFTKFSYAVRFKLAEVPVIGARAAGVKSVNLKDGDAVVDYLLLDPVDASDTKVAMITTRGAFKQFKLSEVNLVSRAKRGVLTLRELKNKPHRVAGVVSYVTDQELQVTTEQNQVTKFKTTEFPIGDRYSNGSFIIDAEKDGVPVKITKLGQIEEENITNLF
ncbi:DNA topoisomerase (ATP-hydrolyzing) subunit A [Amylolactobacillus amylotrophicus DSM 20534]|uniref:DNA topoisomerase 4 subunit A n=3 Tax=Amylolactobacillus TaxID=2767876 RepID=A0A0R1YKD7_9LACO|nr:MULTISPECIES: DNA topoisomerase IV subunit A [Amylolactobacillus]APT19191.1 DNA topoisomerase IV subunit A [Amylolactobacillus amylophilus DSM 20533 = JCM 1125]KRK38534.1 DNA topoisomerase (ATP-hydrolyzing) subunit A [Amylolactobacillus amylotrophicus DSM 20534]KRM42823.1 DNA topoisomerase (ATP-hydrolyzing) subunit A [Amylolactobacillus amylophilus DSM 20533 = JCM 1125]GED79686.1 DNA topoisomerase 4 subunit A [Amylolactobacillus amylophilus]